MYHSHGSMAAREGSCAPLLTKTDTSTAMRVSLRYLGSHVASMLHLRWRVEHEAMCRVCFHPLPA